MVCRVLWLVVARFGAQAGLAYSKTELMYCFYIWDRVSLCCTKSVRLVHCGACRVGAYIFVDVVYIFGP